MAVVVKLVDAETEVVVTSRDAAWVEAATTLASAVLTAAVVVATVLEVEVTTLEVEATSLVVDATDVDVTGLKGKWE